MSQVSLCCLVKLYYDGYNTVISPCTTFIINCVPAFGSHQNTGRRKLNFTVIIIVNNFLMLRKIVYIIYIRRYIQLRCHLNIVMDSLNDQYLHNLTVSLQ